MDPWQLKVEQWSRSPRLFVREAIRATPDPWQDEVLLAIEGGARRIAIRAGHGVGKTALEAWVVLWFVLFRRPCKVPITANSQDQLRDVVWSEISRWWRELPPFLRDLVEVTSERVAIKADPEAAFAVARTARPERPEALQGFHSPNLLFLLEEASGIDDIIFETAGGALTGDNAMVLMCANPTRVSGYFHRAFHGNRASWTLFHVPCSASSRVSASYAEEIAREYGETSNVYRVRVLGEFPLSEDDSVIPLGLIEAAVGREVRPSERAVVWGLDVARFGDDTTALCKRRGNVILEPIKEWRKLDLMQTCGRIVQEYHNTPIGDRPGAINVDVIGLGAGVVDRLRELQLPVHGINVGEVAAIDERRFMRLRDELWFKARDWFDARDCLIPKDDGLIDELVGPKYKIESSGKIKVESKGDMKKRGIRSPNKADAFCLSLAGGDFAHELRSPVAVMDYDPMNVGGADYRRQIGRQSTAGIDDYQVF
jgi:phage terminase large subunit